MAARTRRIGPVKPPPEHPARTCIVRVRRAARGLVFEVIDLRSGERLTLVGVRALSRWLGCQPSGLR